LKSSMVVLGPWEGEEPQISQITQRTETKGTGDSARLLTGIGFFRTPKPQYFPVFGSVQSVVKVCILPWKLGWLEVHHFLDPFLNQPWAVSGGGPESEEREGRLLKKIVEQLISQTPVGALMG
jgi:hypothetical protein